MKSLAFLFWLLSPRVFAATTEELCLKLFQALDAGHEGVVASVMKQKRARCDYKIFEVPDPRLKNLKNRHPDFVGLAQLKKDLVHQEQSYHGSLEKFRQWAKQNQWESFGPRHHFDWWMFPISDESSWGLAYTVLDGDIQQLLTDDDYMKNYREGVRLMMLSWGWDIEQAQEVEKRHPQQRWRGYDVRLRKLIQSLKLFGQLDYLASALTFKKVRHPFADAK